MKLYMGHPTMYIRNMLFCLAFSSDWAPLAKFQHSGDRKGPEVGVWASGVVLQGRLPICHSDPAQEPKNRGGDVVAVNCMQAFVFCMCNSSSRSLHYLAIAHFVLA